MITTDRPLVTTYKEHPIHVSRDGHFFVPGEEDFQHVTLTGVCEQIDKHLRAVAVQARPAPVPIVALVHTYQDGWSLWRGEVLGIIPNRYDGPVSVRNADGTRGQLLTKNVEMWLHPDDARLPRLTDLVTMYAEHRASVQLYNSMLRALVKPEDGVTTGRVSLRKTNSKADALALEPVFLGQLAAIEPQKAEEGA